MDLLKWLRPAVPARPPGAPDLRPRLADSMCRPCARRWLAGKRIWHPGCAEDLRYAFALLLGRYE